MGVLHILDYFLGSSPESLVALATQKMQYHRLSRRVDAGRPYDL
jgi:hypothetical protein